LPFDAAQSSRAPQGGFQPTGGARGGLCTQPNTIDEAFAPYDDGEIVFR
jgi:hypothetical protein